MGYIPSHQSKSDIDHQGEMYYLFAVTLPQWMRDTLAPGKLFFKDRVALLTWLAKGCLGGAILFAPVRFRFLFAARPVETVYRDYTDLIFYLFEFLLLLVLVIWGISLLIRPHKISSGPRFLAIPMLGMMLIAAISALFSIDPILSLSHLLSLSILAGTYLFIVNEMRDMGQISWALVGSLFVHASLGLMQVFRQGSVGLFLLGEHHLDLFSSSISIVWTEGMRSLRAYGLTDHPNILGGVLAVLLLLVLVYYLKPGNNETQRWLLAGIWINGLAGLMLTFSRSAWLGFLSAVLWLFLVLARRKENLVLSKGGMLILLGAIILMPLIWNNLPLFGSTIFLGNSQATEAAVRHARQEQLALNEAANQIFASNAVTGVGIGAFPLALQQSNPNFGFYYQPPHIVLLEAASETGIFGALFYSLMLVSPWLALWINRKRLKFSLPLLGASAALLAITVVGFMDYYPWLLPAGRFWQWLVWGFWATSYSAGLARESHD
jgi:O-antigen ligase